MTPLILSPGIPAQALTPGIVAAPTAPLVPGAPASVPTVALPAGGVAALPSYEAIREIIAQTATTAKDTAPTAAPAPSGLPTAPAQSAMPTLPMIPVLTNDQTPVAGAPKPDDMPVDTGEDGKTVAVQGTNVQPNPNAVALLATLPPLPVAMMTAPTIVEGPALKSIGRAAVTAAKAAPLFFQDDSTDKTDAADFAEDLIAALSASSTTPVTSDTRPPAKIEAPAQVDGRPKLDLSADAWLDQLAKDITSAAAADGKLSFRIVPPHLGRLDIAIDTRDAGVAVHMKAETREARALIAAAQPRLEEALGAQGLRVSETSVTSNGGGDLPRPHFAPQKALIEAVTETKQEAEAPTTGRDASRFA